MCETLTTTTTVTEGLLPLGYNGCYTVVVNLQWPEVNRQDFLQVFQGSDRKDGG